MIRRMGMVGTIFLFLVTASASAGAVSTSLWEQNSKADLEAGQTDGISVIAPGEILLGPKMQVENLDARYSWSLAEDSRGTLYAGTGNEGIVFSIFSKGKTDVFAKTELQQVFTLITDKNDTLYAAGFPGGKIYSISPDGKVTEFYDTAQAAVWALCLGRDGTIFAATGDDGKIFQIAPDGKGKLLYDSRERRLISLIADDQGNVYAGSDQNGIIYKFNREGDVSVLYDTELEEVTAMAISPQGEVYAVSSPGNLFVKMAPPQMAPILSKSMGTVMDAIVLAADVSQSNNGQPAAPLPGIPAIPTAKKRTCIIYKVGKDGAATKFWTSPDELIFSLAFAGENLMAGSGDQGKIYIISPSGESGVYCETDQKQVLALHETRNGALVAGLGNDAAVAQFTGGYASDGTFYSQVHDSTAISRWGRVFWDADVPAGTQILLSTRSGNNEKPDDTWSDWAPADGSAKSFVAPSPNARYIQWRAQLKTSDPNTTPHLRKVTVAYLQNNLPPEVQSITIGDGSKAAKENAAAAANFAAAIKAMAGAACPTGKEDDAPKANSDGVKAVPTTHDPKIKIQWQAQDPNEDTLRYSLYFKGTDEQKWKLLKDELTQASFEWDTETVPDGDYQVKVLATDALDNPAQTALQGEKVSDSFTVDNTAPEVQELNATKDGKSMSYRLSGIVFDKASPISTAHYSIDAGEWVPIFPEDGIFDSPKENVVFEAQALEEGEHTVVLKAVDYYGNIGAGKIVFIAK